MGKNKLRANGYWLWAQIKKQEAEDRGKFEDYLKIIDHIWKDEMSQEAKKEWNDLAKMFRGTGNKFNSYYFYFYNIGLLLLGNIFTLYFRIVH